MENLPHILLALVCLNIALKALDQILLLVKDKTKNDLDNKLYALVNKGAELLGKLLDLLGNKK